MPPKLTTDARQQQIKNHLDESKDQISENLVKAVYHAGRANELAQEQPVTKLEDIQPFLELTIQLGLYDEFVKVFLTIDFDRLDDSKFYDLFLLSAEAADALNLQDHVKYVLSYSPRQNTTLIQSLRLSQLQGYQFLQQGKLEKAKRIFDDIEKTANENQLELDKATGFPYELYCYQFATLQASLGNFDAAIRYFTQLLTVNPTACRITWSALGMMYQIKGDMRLAEQAFERGVANLNAWGQQYEGATAAITVRGDVDRIVPTLKPRLNYLTLKSQIAQGLFYKKQENNDRATSIFNEIYQISDNFLFFKVYSAIQLCLLSKSNNEIKLAEGKLAKSVIALQKQRVASAKIKSTEKGSAEKGSAEKSDAEKSDAEKSDAEKRNDEKIISENRSDEENCILALANIYIHHLEINLDRLSPLLEAFSRAAIQFYLVDDVAAVLLNPVIKLDPDLIEKRFSNYQLIRIKQQILNFIRSAEPAMKIALIFKAWEEGSLLHSIFSIATGWLVETFETGAFRQVAEMLMNELDKMAVHDRLYLYAVSKLKVMQEKPYLREACPALYKFKEDEVEVQSAAQASASGSTQSTQLTFFQSEVAAGNDQQRQIRIKKGP